MTAFARSLEDFGDPHAGRESDADRRAREALAAARGEGHAAGYAEGFAAGMAQADTDERATAMRLIEVAHDFSLQYVAARTEVLAALQPLLEGLVRTVAPVAAARGLAEEIAAAITTRLENTAPQAMTLHVATEHVEAMEQRFGDRVVVEADETLGEHAARLAWPGGGAIFDADAALAEATAAIEAFFGETQTKGLRDAG